jgi:hypothetical protein
MIQRFRKNNSRRPARDRWSDNSRASKLVGSLCLASLLMVSCCLLPGCAAVQECSSGQTPDRIIVGEHESPKWWEIALLPLVLSYWVITASGDYPH